MSSLIIDMGYIQAFRAYLDHVGIDVGTLPIRRLDPQFGKGAPFTHASARLLLESMELAAEQPGRQDLGLEWIQWYGPQATGILGLSWGHFASLGEAVEFHIRHLHLSVSPVTHALAYEGNEVALIINIATLLLPRSRQFANAWLAMRAKVMRSMLGGRWQPVRVEFPYEQPPSILAYQKTFECDLRFSAARFALVVTVEDLERRLGPGNPALLAFLGRNLEQLREEWPVELPDQVVHLIGTQLSGAAPTLSVIADLLGTTPRTLQRRLAECDTDFATLLKLVRVQIARDQLMRRPAPKLAKLAFDLGYSEPSAASRFIKQEFGMPTKAYTTATATQSDRIALGENDSGPS